MKGRNVIWFMAVRNCFRDMRSFMILVFGVSISIAMILVSSASNNSFIKKQKEATEQVTGAWHMAFLYDDDSVIKELWELDGINQVFQSFYIPDVYSKDNSECFQMLAINKNKMNEFIKLYKGEYPKNTYDIILPQWYLDKYMISQIPSELELYGQTMTVVGSFETDYQKTSNQIPVYLAYEENQDLEQYSELQLPWGSNLGSDQEFSEPLAKKIVLLSLEAKTDVRKMEYEIEKINDIFPFPSKEAYGITEYEKEYTAWFNGELISVENFKNAGELTKQGLYAVQKRLHYIYELIIVAVMILFMVTLINLKKGDILFQSGVLKAMGINSLELVGIGLLYLMWVILLAIPIGMVAGGIISIILNTFQYIEIVSVIRNIFIVASCFIGAGFLVMVYSLLMTPVRAMSEGSSDVGKFNNVLLWPKIVNRKHGFNLRYVLRNISLQKKRYMLLASVITMLFTLFAISFTIVSLNHITGNGKQKYKYDILIKKEELGEPTDDIGLITKLKQIEGVQEVLAPLCYDYNITEEQAQEIIVKIPREKLDDILEQKLLLSNYESYVKNEKSYVMSNTGIIGCNTQELDYLKQYVVEGNIEKMYDSSQSYVLLPKYFESYEGSNISMTRYELGDSIELCLTKEGTDQLDPEFSITKTFMIAGFIDTNPFYMSNGVSSEFSVILNADQFKKIVPGTASYIYMKVSEPHYKDVENQVNMLVLQKKGYSIKNTRSNKFLVDMNKKSEEAEKEAMLTIVIGTSLSILIGISNLIFVNKMLRKDEIRLLRIIGLSAKRIRRIDLLETLLYNSAGISVGILISILIINRMKLDLIYTKISNIPWNIWGSVALIMLVVSSLISIVTSIYLEKRLNIN